MKILDLRFQKRISFFLLLRALFIQKIFHINKNEICNFYVEKMKRFKKDKENKIVLRFKYTPNKSVQKKVMEILEEKFNLI